MFGISLLLLVSGTILVSKMPRGFIRKILGYDWIVDLVLTFGIPVLFAGSYSGLVVGIMSGVMLSLALWIAKQLYGYEVYDRSTKTWRSVSKGLTSPELVYDKIGDGIIWIADGTCTAIGKTYDVVTKKLEDRSNS